MKIEQKKIQELEELIDRDCYKTPTEKYENIESFLLQTIRETREEVCKELIEEIESTPCNSQGIGCGLEDVKITDRYESAEYGYEEAIRVCQEIINKANLK